MWPTEWVWKQWKIWDKAKNYVRAEIWKKYLACWLGEGSHSPLGEWDPSPNQQTRYFFQISALTCSWLNIPTILSDTLLDSLGHICPWYKHLFFYFFKIIMNQLVKLTDAIWLLELAISSPLIHALGDWDLNPGTQIEKRTTYKLSYPSPFKHWYCTPV